jgi:hypothetical protein
MMGLRDRQSYFAIAVAGLIQHIDSAGYSVTFGDAYRDPRLHGDFGIKLGYGRQNSVHKLRMAIDLNLFKDGKYLSDTESHRQFGDWWESEYKEFDARWGGRWNDGNHYSFSVWGSA